MMLSNDRHRILVECLAQRTEPVAASTHFCVYGLDSATNGGALPEDLVIVHDFTADQIDNNIGYFVANELLPLLSRIHRSRARAVSAAESSWNEQEIFEHYVGEIVRSMDRDEQRAWHLFYDNTLAGLGQTTAATDLPGDFIDDFRAIYRQTMALIDEMSRSSRRSFGVLDVATCFGFFPLLLALECATKPHLSIKGCDLNTALVNLANGYAIHRNLPHLEFMVADILADGIQESFSPARAFHVVTAIHLLEHLEPWQTQRALENLWKLTKRRLIIAVPLEDVPDPRFGHRQVFDQKRLMAMGRGLGHRCHAFEYHGAWVVIDRT
jgi:2-polyprenyl-3-methyl-5-hydroxy-6-metoxy-1,4-benzoquinol methylase